MIGDDVRLIEPFFYAVDVETMTTSTGNEWTVVAGRLAIGATIVEGIATNATVFVFGCPLPGGDAEKAINFDIHESV